MIKVPDAISSRSMPGLRRELGTFFDELRTTSSEEREAALSDLADSIAESRIDPEAKLDLITGVAIAFESRAPIGFLLVSRSDFYQTHELRLWQALGRTLDARPQLVDDVVNSVIFHVLRFVKEDDPDAVDSGTREGRVAWQMLTAPEASAGRIETLLVLSLYAPIPLEWKRAVVHHHCADHERALRLSRSVEKEMDAVEGASGQQLARRADALLREIEASVRSHEQERLS